MFWGPKNWEGLHEEAGKNATGAGHRLGSGCSVEISNGMGTPFARGKNHILIPRPFHSIAKTPPPLLAKLTPNARWAGTRLSSTTHPLFVRFVGFTALYAQFGLIKDPVSLTSPSAGCVHPSVEVFRVYWLVESMLALLIKSIWPFVGHFWPVIQKDGHTEHWRISNVSKAPRGISTTKRMRMSTYSKW